MLLRAGEQPRWVTTRAKSGPLALGDEAVLADLQPASACLHTQTLAYSIVARPSVEVVAMFVQPVESGCISEAAVQAPDDLAGSSG